MKRLTALVMALIMLFTATAVFQARDISVASSGAEFVAPDTTTILGDINSDGEVTSLDAAFLQRYLVGMRSLTKLGLKRADADLDGSIGSLDVTTIQRYLANFDGTFYLEMDADEAKAAKIVDETPTEPPVVDPKAEIIDQINSFTRSKGVDISEFNGNVDMNKIKAAGYEFVIIRLGYGDDETDQDDTRFEENVRKAEAAGLDWGAYIYSYALSVNEAKSEVNHTLRLLKGKHPTMPIAFDWEDDSYKDRMGMPSNATVLKIAQTYLSGIRSAGYYPMIYTGYSWLKGAFNDSSIIDTYDIWYAQWSKTYDYHDRPLGMWQYGGETNYIESPTISGLSGTFDKNYSYKNYPVIIKAYGYNNHVPLLTSYASTGYDHDDGIAPQSENLPPECNGVMGDSLKKK